MNEFCYPESRRAVLHDIRFTLRPGQLLGLCGPTGCGKSTLLALIQRHYDVTAGSICFQGRPLPELTFAGWHARLAVVNQTPFLFSDTIANNIALGRPGQHRKKLNTRPGWPVFMMILNDCRSVMRLRPVSGA